MQRQFTSKVPDVPNEPPFVTAASRRDDTASLVQSFHFGPAATSDEEPRFMEQVQMFIGRAASQASIKPDLLEYIRSCDHALRFQIPLRRDNGTIETLTCYRVQHKHYYMPCKGGVRFTPDLTLQETVGHAIIMSVKMMVGNIPFSGSKGGVRFDPSQYSEAELQRVTRKYTMELAKKGFIGPHSDSLGPDVGTNSQIMTWIKDTYVQLYGEKDLNASAVCTGKKITQGGIEGRQSAAGEGAYMTLRKLANDEHFCDKADMSTGLRGKKFIVQGFGNVGYSLCKAAHNDGARIIGVIEKDAGIYNSKGLNPDDLKEHFDTHGTIGNFPGASEVEIDDPTYIMRKKCHVFAPCAREGTLNMHNAGHLKAQVVLEGANGPTTFKAD